MMFDCVAANAHVIIVEKTRTRIKTGRGRVAD